MSRREVVVLPADDGPAIKMIRDPVAEAGDAFGEQLLEEVPVTGKEEHILAAYRAG